jgi:hypothetical protein
MDNKYFLKYSKLILLDLIMENKNGIENFVRKSLKASHIKTNKNQKFSLNKSIKNKTIKNKYKKYKIF